MSPLRARTRMASRGNARMAPISPLKRAVSNNILRARGEKWVSSPRKSSLTVRGVGLRNLARNAGARRDVAQMRAEAPLWRLRDEGLDYYEPVEAEEEEEMEIERMIRRRAGSRLSSRQARRLLSRYYRSSRETRVMRRGDMAYADSGENEEHEIEDENVVGGSGRRSRLGFADFGEGFPDESTTMTATPPRDREKTKHRRSSSLLRDAPRGRPTGNPVKLRNDAAKPTTYGLRRNIRSITKVGPRVVSAGRPKSDADSAGSGVTRRLRTNGAPTNTGVVPKPQKAKEAAKKVVTQTSDGAASHKLENSETVAAGNSATPRSSSGDDPEEEWSFRPAEVQGARPPTRRDVSHPLDL